MLEEVLKKLGICYSDEHLIMARKQIAELNEYAKDKAPELSEEYLVKRHQGGFSQTNGLLQTICFPHTPQMLFAVYRICQGFNIEELTVSYNKVFNIKIKVKHIVDDIEEAYESDNVFDFTILRHIACFTMDNKPILDGFYPLRIG